MKNLPIYFVRKEEEGGTGRPARDRNYWRAMLCLARPLLAAPTSKSVGVLFHSSPAAQPAF